MSMVSRIAILLMFSRPKRPSAIIISRLDKPKKSGVSGALDLIMPVTESVLIPSGIAAERISSIDCLLIWSEFFECFRQIRVIPVIIHI